MMYDIAIKNGRVYMNGTFIETHVYIKDEKIIKISNDDFETETTVDAQGLEVLPGIIDPHVHFELDLGFITSVDDFYTGTVAAAYGGVTTIIDFLDPTSHVSHLQEAFDKRQALAKKSVVDYAFHATIRNPKSNLEAYVKKMQALNIPTLKLFTTYADSGRRTYDPAIIDLLKLSKQYKFLILAHIENDDLIRINEDFTYRELNDSRPTISEIIEALKLAEYTKTYGGYMYMVHLSSGKTLDALINAYRSLLNKRFYVESCPQYFSFNNRIFKEPDGYLYTCAPPLRSKEEQALLFKHAQDIYTIGTDHCAFNKKDKDVLKLSDMPLGVGGVEHSFTVMRHHLGDDVIDKMTKHVAKVHGLKFKGEIKEGFDADLFIYEPLSAGKITENHAQSDYSIYENHPVDGRVISTMVRGRFVVDNGKFCGGKGKPVERGMIHVDSTD